jgi:hypothetical protein
MPSEHIDSEAVGVYDATYDVLSNADFPNLSRLNLSPSATDSLVSAASYADVSLTS